MLPAIHELIVDAYGCTGDLSDVEALTKAAREAVTKLGATIAAETSHKFQPHGATICLVLKESHFIVSTWPEHQYAVVNIFLCNPDMDTKKCWEMFSKVLKPKDAVFHEVVHVVERPTKRIAAVR